jgi:glycosyltransferase involved in cell wall biosynthesis
LTYFTLVFNFLASIKYNDFVKWLVASLLAGAGAAAYIDNEKVRSRCLKAVTTPPDYIVEGPPVSAIIPTRLEESYLPLLLPSLRNQTYHPIEIIVADFESFDQTYEVARSFDAYVVSVRERGVGPARNEGAAVAQGEYLLFIDADCILESRLVERMMRKLEDDPSIMLVHPGIGVYDSRVIGVGRSFFRWFQPRTYTSRCVLVRREAFEAVGGYRNIWREDLEFGRAVERTFGSYSVRYLAGTYIATSGRREMAILAGKVPTSPKPDIPYPAVRDGQVIQKTIACIV